jgi:exodeoxyribonuclease III
MIKIISWNVNGIRAVEKKGFVDWMQLESPDILCVQETKAHPEQLSQELKEVDEYESFWASAEKRGYSGVAIYTKKKPLEVRVLGDERFDSEGRVLILLFDDFAVVNAYFPNSQEGGKRLDYKLDFCNTLLETCDSYVKQGIQIVLTGDYNIAHKRIDLKNPDRNENNPGFFPVERAWMDQFIEAGYVDTFRLFCQDPDQYTWWSYRFRAREKNIGWRIDYQCVSAGLRDSVEESGIMSDVMGSDHCPVSLVLKSPCML